MSNALRDQLLKAGLVDEKRLKQARAPKKRKHRGAPPAPDPQAEAARQARAQEAERSRELNRKQQQAAERKARAAQIRQIVEANRLPRDNAEIAYGFQHDTKVRRVYVTPEQQRQLVAGQLAVVSLAGGYELVPREAADKIRERDPARVVAWNDPDAPPSAPAEDDPYAGYQVPDDLMW
ncbi:DUF2058 domain-containing protein [Ectothiorhodospiraceae bacterium 2226]|nr:DUF2058 domain-containing protein [Ectothiorhodospiraceae bacterium 2226]